MSFPSSEEVVHFSPDGSRIAGSTPDGRLLIWNSAGTLLQQFSPSSHLSAACTCLVWCPLQRAITTTPKKKKKSKASDTEGNNEREGDLIALGTSAGTVLLYSVKQGDLVTSLEAAQSSVKVNCVTWSHSARSILAGTQDGMVTIFSVLELKSMVRFKAGKEPVTSIAVTPDDKKIITGSRKIKVWDVRSQKLLQTFMGHTTPVSSLYSFCLGAGGNNNNENYILSCGESDWTVSVWRISGDDAGVDGAKSEPAHATLSVNDSVKQMHTLTPSTNSSELGSEGANELYTSVTTKYGSLVIFKYSLAADSRRKKPFKPSHTLQVATKTDKSSVTETPTKKSSSKVEQISVLGSSFKLSTTAESTSPQPVLHLAYGTTVKLVGESLPLSTVQTNHCLVRETPTINIGSDVQTDFTKVVTPKLNGNVKYLAPGANIGKLNETATTPTNGVEGRKRKKSVGSSGKDETGLALEERLALLQTADKVSASHRSGPPRADTLVQLLVQGLQGKDASILNSVLDRADEVMIENTVARLPVETILPLVTALQKYIKGRGASNFSHARWLRSVLSNHTGYLVTVPEARELLVPLYSLLEARTANYNSILQLKGKLDLLTKQMSKESDSSSDKNIEADPLLVFQDDSDCEDPAQMIDNLFPPGPEQSDDDDLDLDGYNEDSDDQDLSNDDVISVDNDSDANGAVKMTNGGGSESSEEEEEMDED